MDQTVGGKDGGSAERVRPALEVGDFSTRLFDEDNAGGRVPGIEAKFPEAIEAAQGDIGKIEGGGTVSTNAVREQGEIPVEMNVGVCVAIVVGKTGAEQTVLYGVNFGAAHPLFIEESAFATSSVEEFVVNGIVDDAEEEFLVAGEGHGDTEAGIPVGKVGGAIERIDMPAILCGVFCDVFACAFLGGDGVIWEIFL